MLMLVVHDGKTRYRFEIGRYADIEKGDEIEIHSKNYFVKSDETNAYKSLSDDDYKILKMAK